MPLRNISVILAVLCVTALCLAQPASAKRKIVRTSVTEAQACFDKALTDAKTGATPAAMIKNYLDINQVAGHAFFVQGLGIWSDLSKIEKAPYLANVRAYLRENQSFDDVKLDSVTTIPARAKQNGETIELPGAFRDANNTPHTFGVLIVAHSKQCFFIDARWDDAWLSTHISISN